MLKIVFIIFVALAGTAVAATGADENYAAEARRTYEGEQFVRRKFGTLTSEDVARWTPEMNARFKKDNP
ncbi:MAG: hypothetical protein NTW87_03180, partial [Planctomycetota bacterium]|nr:hypothetical protein [Planctomycetota bacterium]